MANVNEPIINEPRPSKFVVAGQLRQAIGHDAPGQVIAAYRAQLKTERAEKALRRVLDEAPPLTSGQIGYLHAVLTTYAEAEPDEPSTNEAGR